MILKEKMKNKLFINENLNIKIRNFLYLHFLVK
jgi:hypothetical protein